MELAYGRGIFHRYAVTGTDALHLLDELVDTMQIRKTTFAGHVRTVPLSPEHPLELLEFDEIGALTKYTDRKTREAHGAPPRFRTSDPIRSAPEWRGRNARTAQEVHT
jgi:DNA segregation ATPase FtsK/SpoIIIE, S-DNA-T family